MMQRFALLLVAFLFLRDVGVAQSGLPATEILQDFEMPSSVTVPAKGGVEFNAQINGTGPFPLLFDSGAGVNVLSPAAAKRLGLHVEEDPLQIAGAGGYALMRRARVDTLRIGDLVLRNQEFYVMNLPWEHSGGVVGAVGYELMRRFAVKVDYEHEQLTFRPLASFTYSGPGIKVPMDVVHRELEVHGSVDGASGVFVIDTGNEASFFLEPGFVKRNDLVNRLHARYHGYSGSGAGGPMPAAYYARVGKLRLGEAEGDDVITLLLEDHSGPEVASDGNLGTGFLRRFNVTVDCMRGALYLEKNSNWGKPGIFNRAGIVTDSILQDQTIRTILPGSPAEIAGIMVGDVLLRIDGRAPSNDPLEQNDPAFLQPVGTVVRLRVKRGTKVRNFKVSLKDMF